MTNKGLSNFRNIIHHSLKAKEKNGCLCVSEQEESSSIKEIYFSKGNADDVLIIQQDIKNCRPIENLFEGKARVNSCDFIVLICKNKGLHIFFCEIKSSNNKENCKKALKQINSSKIFFEYLYKNYLEHFETKDFEISVENSENIYIYPASNSQKNPTFAPSKNRLIFKKIKIDSNGNTTENDIYHFFGV